MSKHTLSKITLSAAVLAVAILFTGCPREPDNAGSIPDITFNITNAKALATGSTNKVQRNARSSRAAFSNSFLQKVLENGSIESAISMTGGEGTSHWGKLDAVIKPPASANSTDIILHFDDLSYAKVHFDDETTGTWWLGSLLLVHEDGSYDDIAREDSNGNQPDFVRYSSCAKYTKDGTILFLGETKGENGEFNFKSYDPSTKETSLIFHLDRGDDNSQIQSFQISDDEKYVYLFLTSNTNAGLKSYIKVISIENPSDFVDLGNIIYGVDGWAYSSYDDCLYYTVRDKEKEDHVEETQEPFQFIYKINKSGKGEKELLQTAFCPAIIPTAKNKAWCFYYIGNEDITIKTTVLENLVSPDAANPETIEYNIPSIHTYANEYLQVGDTVYLLHERWNEDSTMQLHTIYSVNTSTKQAVNVMEKIPDTDKISISSWSANEESLFISGIYENGSAANFKVDLATLEPTPIDSSTAFTCIAAL